MNPEPGQAVVTLIVLLRGTAAHLWRGLESAIAQIGCAEAKVNLAVVADGQLTPNQLTHLHRHASHAAFTVVTSTLDEEPAVAVCTVLAQIKEGHALLLDAEIELPAGCLGKLLAAAGSQPQVASVTPFSNGNGKGLTAVAFLQHSDGSPVLPVAQLDAAAATANPATYLQLPSAGAGCVLLTRQALDCIQQAATAKGHTERVLQAFTQHLTHVGMVNLLACDTFVADWRQQGHSLLPPAVESSALAVSQPQQLGAARVALCLQAMHQSGVPLVLQVTHRIGGGVERHVRELQTVLAGRAWVLVLRPSAKPGAVRLAFGAADAVDQLDFNLPADAAHLQWALLSAGLARIHIHHINGFCEALWPALLELERPVDLTLHDYTIIAGSPTLTNNQGRYTGLQAVAAYEFADAARAQRLQALARSAQRCIVPSHDMQQRLLQALPWLTTCVHSHPDQECVGLYPAPRAPHLSAGQPLRVLCLGALGREKGVEVLRDVAALALRQGLPIAFSLLGSAHIPLGAAVKQLGTYRDEQLPALLAREQPHLLWFPVQWPETWSYTLSAGLEAGLAVLASRVGAFGERLQGRPLTWLQPHDATAAAWLACLNGIRQQWVTNSGAAARPLLHWPQQRPPEFYRATYLPAQAVVYTKPPLPPASSWAAYHLGGVPGAIGGGWRVRLLRGAMRMRAWPVARWLLACVPYNLQRRIKRLLSSAPLY